MITQLSSMCSGDVQAAYIIAGEVDIILDLHLWNNFEVSYWRKIWDVVWR